MFGALDKTDILAEKRETNEVLMVSLQLLY